MFISLYYRFVSILFKAFLPPVFVNGFSFEAHLQNVLARFDSKSGELVGFAVRDYGGIKHLQDTLFESIGERADVLKDNVTEAKNLFEVRHTSSIYFLSKRFRVVKLNFFFCLIGL